MPKLDLVEKIYNIEATINENNKLFNSHKINIIDI